MKQEVLDWEKKRIKRILTILIILSVSTAIVGVALIVGGYFLKDFEIITSGVFVLGVSFGLSILYVMNLKNYRLVQRIEKGEFRADPRLKEFWERLQKEPPGLSPEEQVERAFEIWEEINKKYCNAGKNEER